MKLPQLSLRELFLLVALVAMGLGWWIERWNDRNEIANSKQVIHEMAKHFGVKGGYGPGYLYLDGKRIWATDSKYPPESHLNCAGIPTP